MLNNYRNKQKYFRAAVYKNFRQNEFTLIEQYNAEKKLQKEINSFESSNFF